MRQPPDVSLPLTRRAELDASPKFVLKLGIILRVAELKDFLSRLRVVAGLNNGSQSRSASVAGGLGAACGVRKSSHS